MSQEQSGKMNRNNPPYLNQPYPIIASKPSKEKLPASVRIYEFYAISNGNRKRFTDQDAVEGYNQHGILPPQEVSYINLFINGVLQPEMNYVVRRGELELKTEDAPVKGALIILQMVKV